MECVFCKSETNSRAKEHIFPVWMLKEFGFREDMVMPTHLSETGEAISSRLHDMDSFVLGRVCKVCNNGWMNDLEIQNRSLITDLARGRRDVLDLADAEAVDLAHWCMKTALCLHASANWRTVVPREHYWHLADQKVSLPEGVRVVGKTRPLDGGFSWIQSTSWSIHQERRELRQDELESIRSTCYKITIQIEDFLFLVAYNPFDYLSDVAWKYTHVPLYPRKGPVSWLLLDDELSSTHLDALAMFHVAFGLAVTGPIDTE